LQTDKEEKCDDVDFGSILPQIVPGLHMLTTLFSSFPKGEVIILMSIHCVSKKRHWCSTL